MRQATLVRHGLCLLVMVWGAPVAADTNKAGEAVGSLLPLAVLVTTWRFEEDTEGLRQLAWSAVTAEITTELLKQIIKKDRPSGSCCAMPSGHATRAFYSAAFLDRRYGRKAGIPAYLAATFVAYSRVESDHHFEADVVVGAAIGWLSSRYFTTRYEGIRILPTADTDSVGLLVEVVF